MSSVISGSLEEQKRLLQSALEAAQWIGFSEDVIQALSTHSTRLKSAIELLGRLPEVRKLHAERKVSEEVTKGTLMDMEVWLRDHYQKCNTWGFTAAGWLEHHFSGRVYALGRLQFQTSDYDLPKHYALPKVSDVLSEGDQILYVHIPATGKLDDAECTKSFERVMEFFPLHFPEHKFKAFVCESWIMDPALKKFLPEKSNLLSFQRRFHHIELPGATDEQMWERVFPKGTEGTLQTTSLQREILEHYRTGGKCCMAAGYILREEISNPDKSD
jgi:hypothetical protein